MRRMDQRSRVERRIVRRKNSGRRAIVRSKRALLTALVRVIASLWWVVRHHPAVLGVNLGNRRADREAGLTDCFVPLTTEGDAGDARLDGIH